MNTSCCQSHSKHIESCPSHTVEGADSSAAAQAVDGATVLKGTAVVVAAKARKKRQTYSLADLQACAAERGGTCLSPEYPRGESKPLWKCGVAEHPLWQAKRQSVMEGSWCAICAKYRQHPENELELMQDHATAMGGKLLDTEYHGNEHLYRWKCNVVAHAIWSRKWKTVKECKSWCPLCSGKPSLNPAGTLLAMQGYAEARGGKLLSTAFTVSHGQYEWKCDNSEHPSWFTTWETVKVKKSWCGRCAGRRGLPQQELQAMQDYAGARRGQLLDSEYKGPDHKYRWTCEVAEHGTWTAKWKSLKTGAWCGLCAKNRQDPKLEFQVMRDYAELRGGELLSPAYVTGTHRYEWKCLNPDHPSWRMMWSKYKNNGAWCTLCSGTQHVPEQELRAMNEYATCRNGALLDSAYQGETYPYLWQCADAAHQPFKRTWGMMKRVQSWCNLCSGRRVDPQQQLLVMQAYATSRGGSLLDTEFHGTETSYRWKCDASEHPPFNALWWNLKHKSSWCPECSADRHGGAGISEAICRALMELLFGSAFPSALPAFLPGADGVPIPFVHKRRLTLDGYSPELGLAFEYMGEQHYGPVPYFGGEKALKYIQGCDAAKRACVAKSAVTLVELKGIERYVRWWAPEKLIGELIEQLRAQGLAVRGLHTEECERVVTSGLAAARSKQDFRKQRKQWKQLRTLKTGAKLTVTLTEMVDETPFKLTA